MKNNLKIALVAALSISTVSAMDMDRSSPEYYHAQAKAQVQNGNTDLAKKYLGLEKKAKQVQANKHKATQLKAKLNKTQMVETPQQEVGVLTRLYNYILGWFGY